MKAKISQEPGFTGEEKCPPVVTDDMEIPGFCSCLLRRIYLLPVITAVWLAMAFILSYIISTVSGRTEPDFPYISYTAREDPERCIFGQFVNVGAVLLCSNGVVRYLYIKRILIISGEERRWYHWNVSGLCLIIVSSLGLSMVGNFPTSVEKVPHYLGAASAFGSGVAYCWVQTRISWKTRKRCDTGKASKYTTVLQLAISISATVFLVLFGITATIYKSHKDDINISSISEHLRGIYLTSTISEWLLAVSYSTFILTFIPSFSRLKLKAASVEIKKEMNETFET